MKFAYPKNPNWEKYCGLSVIRGEPKDPRCPYCEADGHDFGLLHVTIKWVYYQCFKCSDPCGGAFRVPRRDFTIESVEKKS